MIGTWFQCLVKMVHKVASPHENGPEFALNGDQYAWFEMGFFTRWDSPGQCRILCIDVPEDLQYGLLTTLGKQLPIDIIDPFTMHRHLFDQILALYDISVWRVRDLVRQIEKVTRSIVCSNWPDLVLTYFDFASQSRKHAGNKFDEMHEIARHGIHATEALAVSIETLDAMRKYQLTIYDHDTLKRVLGGTQRRQADEYTGFQLQALKSLKLRSDSNNKRLENEISLVS